MKKLFAVAAAAVASLFVVAPMTAQATDPLPTVHPGMSITMNGGPTQLPEGSTCTLAAVGHDSTGRLLGLAAGHCIPPSEAPEVYTSNGPFGVGGNGVHIGNWITKPTGFPGIYTDPNNQDLSRDGAFFEILPGIPVSNQLPNGTRINGIQSAGPNFLQHHCKYGQLTQTTCGWVTKTGSPFESTAGAGPGDSGGPAYTASFPNQPTGKLLGITSAMMPNRYSDITNILADAATQGVTGFTPLP